MLRWLLVMLFFTAVNAFAYDTYPITFAEGEYIALVPNDNVPANATLPLIVCLHGKYSTPENIIGTSRFNLHVVDQEQVIVVYPRGVNGPVPWTYNDKDFVLAVISDVESRIQIHLGYTLDRKRIYGVGHSYGGWLTHILGIEHSETFAAIGTVAGGWPENPLYTPEPDHEVGVMAFHNIHDPVVSPIRCRMALNQWHEWNGCDNVSLSLHPTFIRQNHTLGPDTKAVGYFLTTDHGEGTPNPNHLWPHFGTDGVEPCVMFWAFFSNFVRE